MSLIKQLKKIPKVLMLSAAIAAAGCTTTPWHAVERKEIPIGTERTETKDAGMKRVGIKSFNISDNYIENGMYKTRITESLNNSTYKLEEVTRTRKFNEIWVEQRESEGGTGLLVLGGVVGFGGGIFLEEQINDPEGKEGITLEQLGWGALGALGGAALGAVFAPLTVKTEKRQQNVGVREGSSKETNEIFLSENSVYKNIPAFGVRFGIVGNSETYQITDPNGIISWKNENPNLFVSREGLEKRLYELPLIQEIKPRTRELLRKRFLEAASVYGNQITIETREQPSHVSEKVENCKKILKFNYYQLRDEDIYNVVRQFVDEEINSSMKTLSLVVKDDLTHVPISGSDFEFSTDSPSKSELAGRYFTGGLRDYAENSILDYLYGKGKIERLPDEIQMRVYSPSNIFLEVTNPKYNFVSGKIAVNGDIKKTVYMVDKGSKVRVQNSVETSGRIE
jgi:hypothetical protein